MNKELDTKLMKRFPFLYRERFLPMSTTCMCWGFACGDGWFSILWQLSLAIEEELGITKWKNFRCRFHSWRVVRRNARLTKRIDRYKNRLIKKFLKRTGYKDLTAAAVAAGYTEYQGLRIFNESPEGKKYLKYWNKKRFNFTMPYEREFSVSQVKEKFGGLRFYTHTTNDNIEELVRLAERTASVTCERCGRFGRLRSDGWMVTLCDRCAFDERRLDIKPAVIKGQITRKINKIRSTGGSVRKILVGYAVNKILGEKKRYMGARVEYDKWMKVDDIYVYESQRKKRKKVQKDT